MDSKTTTSGSEFGCLGAIVAIMLSIKVNGVTWWLLLHGLCGWFYIAYWFIFISGCLPTP